MVSRRQVLQLGASILPATAGCLTELRQSNSGPSDTVGDGTNQTPGDVPEWTPQWTLPFDTWHVLGLDSADGLLYVTLSKNNGPSAVAAVDPDAQSLLWQTTSEGEAVGGSHASYQHIARGQWGVTLAEKHPTRQSLTSGDLYVGGAMFTANADGEASLSVATTNVLPLAPSTSDGG